MKNIIIITISILSFYYTLCSDQNSIIEDVKNLSSEEFEGRKPGTKGIEKAALYIESKFNSFGLKNFNSSYRQKFDVLTGKKLKGENDIFFNVIIPKPGIPKNRLRSRKKQWTLEKDWYPLAFSSNGEVDKGELVFAGYGISSKDLKYDDYEGIDVKDKVVIVLTNAPGGDESGGKFRRFSSYRYKTFNAKDKGAKAIIFLKVQGDSSNVFERLNNVRHLQGKSDIIAFQANRFKIEKFFPKNNRLSDMEEKINKSLKPNSFVLPNCDISIKLNIENDSKSTSNILAYVEGSENQDEFIILGAHYDHIGWGGPNSRYFKKPDKIHYGADDNASGTSAILELARRISDKPLKKSVLFLAFSAEEMGLLGSKYFIENLPIKNEQIITFINFDMVGRMVEDNLHIFGTGTSAEFDSYIDEVNNEFNLKVKKVKTGNGPSDHASFYRANKPVMMFFSGIHSDYHTPNDVFEKINTEGINTIVNFAEKIINKVDNGVKPKFIKVDDPNMAKMGRTSAKVWFGVMPTYDQYAHGFVIEDVVIGGPAAIAGIIAGDIITEIDGKVIKNIYDFMFSYIEKKPGDILTVKILRNNKKEYTLKVKLKDKTKRKL